MQTRIRQIVALVSLPLALSSGLAFAARPGPVTEIAFKSDCAASLIAAEAVVRTEGAYVKGARWEVNRDALLAKLMGIDLKLLEDPPKAGDAMMIVDDIMQKVAAWSDPDSKPKLTEWGVTHISRTVMNETGDPLSVANCIHSTYAY